MATVDVKGLTAYGVSHSRAFAGTRRSAIGRYATCALSAHLYAHLYHPGTGQWTHTVLSLTTHDALRRHASRQWSHCVMCMYATVIGCSSQQPHPVPSRVGVDDRRNHSVFDDFQ